MLSEQFFHLHQITTCIPLYGGLPGQWSRGGGTRRGQCRASPGLLEELLDEVQLDQKAALEFIELVEWS